MVMRTLEIRKIRFLIPHDRIDHVVSRLREINKALEITVNGDEVQVAGDLHNTKMCKNILKFLWARVMGRLYRAIEVASGDRHAYTVGFIDTGADNSVISRRLADSMNIEQKGYIEMVSASGHLIVGRQAEVYDSRETFK